MDGKNSELDFSKLETTDQGFRDPRTGRTLSPAEIAKEKIRREAASQVGAYNKATEPPTIKVPRPMSEIPGTRASEEIGTPKSPPAVEQTTPPVYTRENPKPGGLLDRIQKVSAANKVKVPA